ncbi:MAG: acyltransferase [Alphaproteobacteria bacterium]|nr:acyltransferase [Alphaproteobacteria bacterium]
MSTLTYQPSLDGLRTIAVGTVIAYHLDLPFISGGFVGVDVFFVLSGYLISSLIFREVEAGTFTLVNFYDRRIRRIIPALFVMLAFTMLASFLFLLPSALKLYGASLVGAALSAANFVFFLQSGYFSTDASFRPLLHAWSLSIEEQFYLIYPLVMLLAWRFGRRTLFSLLLVVFALSLGGTVWQTGISPTAAFYLPQFRAWELMAGGIIAFMSFRIMLGWVGPSLAAVAGWLGIVAILTASFAYSIATPFPGIAAVLPVAGAALVIVAAGRDAAWGPRVVLNLPPVVYLGKISYSLYLWHWPLIVFYRHFAGIEIGGAAQLALLALTVLFSAASYHFVEMPFRKGFGWNSVFKRYAWAAAFAIALCSVGTGYYLLQGLPTRFDPDVLQIARAAQDNNPRRQMCHSDEDFYITFDRACVYGDPAAVPSVLVWGDSHGAELSMSLGERLADRAAALKQLTSSRCPPFLEVDFPDRSRCRKDNEDVIAALKTAPEIETVVLIAHYQNHFIAGRTQGLGATLDALKSLGKHVVVVGQAPTPKEPVPERLAQLARQGDDVSTYWFAPDWPLLTAIDGFLESQALAHGADFVDPRQVLCAGDDALCLQSVDGDVLYFDGNHLSMAGSRRVAPLVVKAIYESNSAL